MTQRNENHIKFDESIYNLDEQYIGKSFCKLCERWFNGDFGFLNTCNNCLLQ